MKDLVVVGCPMSMKTVHGEPHFTGLHWLKKVMDQDYENMIIYIHFNNLLDEYQSKVIELTADSKREIWFTHGIYDYPIDSRDIGRVRTAVKLEQKPYDHFSNIRNDWMRNILALSDNVKYIMSLDSDILIHSDTISRLVALYPTIPDLGMLGIPVNNGRRVTKEYPQGLYHGRAQYNFGRAVTWDRDASSLTRYRGMKTYPTDGRLIEVDYTGAACIMDADIIRQLEPLYGAHPQGEDCYACHNMKRRGYTIWVDTSHTTLHMMEPNLWQVDLEKFTKREII